MRQIKGEPCLYCHSRNTYQADSTINDKNTRIYIVMICSDCLNEFIMIYEFGKYDSLTKKNK